MGINRISTYPLDGALLRCADATAQCRDAAGECARTTLHLSFDISLSFLSTSFFFSAVGRIKIFRDGIISDAHVFREV